MLSSRNHFGEETCRRLFYTGMAALGVTSSLVWLSPELAALPPEPLVLFGFLVFIPFTLLLVGPHSEDFWKNESKYWRN